MSKVKVFTLAKKYGYKSADFVGILRDIGFPVSSYQASVEEWDVPVIEERLRKGGLLKSGDDGGENGKGADQGEGGGASSAPSFEELAAMMSASKSEDTGATATAEEAPADEADAPEEVAPAEQPQAAADEAAAETAPAAEESEAAEQAEESAPEAPVETGTSEEAPPAEAAGADGTPTTEAEAEQAADEAPAAEPPTPKPAPRPQAEAATEKPAAKEPPQPKPAPKKGDAPRPRPKRGASKVGKIDLEALGLIKSQQQQRRRSSTFSDIRDRVAATRRDQRQREREKMRARRQGKVGPKKVSTVARKKDVVLQSPVTVKNFSEATGIPVNDIVRKLMRYDVMATANAGIDADTVELLAEELNLDIQYREEEDIEQELMKEVMAARKAVDDSTLQPRDPVIAFLGHVDHGKTSLIDAIREARVAGKEAGGITQHIGAYKAELPGNKSVTILDTPGHEAFTAMRARGAETTDVVVLVVAADDGVMPQTEEAAAHARAAGTPMVVAINKIDVPGANPEQVKAQLAKIGLQPEDWGGDTGVVEVSALRKQGIDNLLERVLLEAEVLDLKAHARGDAMGTVLEASLEQGRGKMVTVLVQDGTLKAKDVILSGHAYGKIRLMFDHNGKPVKKAGPSTPVELSGFDELPPIGEKFYVVKDARAAKAVADRRLMHKTELERANKSKVSMSNIFEKIDESQAKRLRFVLKADVQGTIEVLRSSLEEMSSDEVIVEIVHAAVGGVSENDVMLAHTAEGVVVAFNVAPDGKAKKAAEREGVEIRRYDVIYDLVEDVERAVEGLLEPDTVEEECGHAVVLDVFRSSKFGTIAGCRIEQGYVRRNCKIRIVRDGKPVYEAPIASLRRFKDDVREVLEGNECGIKVHNFEDIKVGDEFEIIEVVERTRTLEEAQAGAED